MSAVNGNRVAPQSSQLPLTNRRNEPSSDVEDPKEKSNRLSMSAVNGDGVAPQSSQLPLTNRRKEPSSDVEDPKEKSNRGQTKGTACKKSVLCFAGGATLVIIVAISIGLGVGLNSGENSNGGASVGTAATPAKDTTTTTATESTAATTTTIVTPTTTVATSPAETTTTTVLASTCPTAGNVLDFCASSTASSTVFYLDTFTVPNTATNCTCSITGLWDVSFEIQNFSSLDPTCTSSLNFPEYGRTYACPSSNTSFTENPLAVIHVTFTKQANTAASYCVKVAPSDFVMIECVQT